MHQSAERALKWTEEIHIKFMIVGASREGRKEMGL